MLLTRPPLDAYQQAGIVSARLACVKPAASVRSEPGSNSQVDLNYPAQTLTQTVIADAQTKSTADRRLRIPF